jgi:hypothetical protein
MTKSTGSATRSWLPVVTLAVAFLTACGGQPPPAPTTPPAATPTGVSTPTVAATPTDRPSATPASSSAGPSSPTPQIGGTWRQAADAPRPRAEFAAAALDGRLYAVGGFDARQPGTGLLDVDVYDPVTDSWASAAPLPVERDHPALVEHAGRLYFLGGQDGGPRADAFVYDPGVDEAIAAMPAPRAQHAAVAIQDRIYVFGGVTPAGPGGAALETWAYEPATGTWITGLAPIPTQRNHLVGVALDGRAWAIGGRWDLNETAVASYEPRTDTWRSEAPLPVATGGATAVVLGGRIHVTGGEDFVSFSTIGAHQVYDPATSDWALGPQLPLPRHGLASAVIGGEWIVVGGGPAADYSASPRVDVFAP